MSNATVPLLPCPFCSRENPASFASQYDKDMMWQIRCSARWTRDNGCNAKIVRPTEAEAIEAWNRRPAQSAQPVEQEAVEKAGVLFDGKEYVNVPHVAFVEIYQLRDKVAFLTAILEGKSTPAEPIGDSVRLTKAREPEQKEGQ